MNVSYNCDKLKIIFMGTPEFAVPSLEILLDHGYEIKAVITAPDKPAGRGRKPRFSAVKEFSLKKGLNILQPLKLKDSQLVNELKALQSDLQVVVAFRILPEEIWSIPPLGTFNLHASLLPQYRGAAPINRAIINGETETGLTTFFIDHNVDTGHILLQEKVEISTEDNAGSLHDKMMLRGAELVLKTVKMIGSGNITQIPQDKLFGQDSSLRSAPKIEKNDCRINWNKSGNEIVNLIRGLSPYPTAYSSLLKTNASHFVKIFEAGFIPGQSSGEPGTIISDNRRFLHVSVKDGYVEIKSLQLEGKKRMDTGSFLVGFRDISEYTVK